MTTDTAAVAYYRSAFDRFIERRPGTEPPDVTARRHQAMRAFVERGFPTTRDEDWKYTSVAPIAETRFAPPHVRADAVTAAELRRACGGHLPPNRLVFVNGRYAPELSDRSRLPGGVRLVNLAHAIDTHPDLLGNELAAVAVGDQGNPFVALNTAFYDDGVVLRIGADVVVEDPIRLVYLATASGEPFAAHPRTLLIAGRNSQASVVETYAAIDESQYLTNAVTEVVVGANAAVELVKLQAESRGAYHIGATDVRLASDSRFSSVSVALGGSLVRNDLSVTLDGSGISCSAHGLSLASGRQHIDNHTFLDHALPHCESHQIYRSILGDRARGVFNGKILVRPQAQKTDAKQTNQAILLSPDATMDTKPQLEIFADDVKCTHGATVGHLDEESVFYLRTRGIGETEARRILVHAFAQEVVQRVQSPAVRNSVEAALLVRLPKD